MSGTIHEQHSGGAAPVHPPPRLAQATLDPQLQAQRLRLVRTFAVVLGLLAGPFGVLFVRSGLQPLAVPLVVLGTHLGLLAVAALCAVYWCNRTHLRTATYMLALPLISQGLFLLALTTNTQAAAVICFCLTINIAAIALEQHEWPRLSSVLGLCILLAYLLHYFPILTQAVLPRSLAVAATVGGTIFGLGALIGLCWLFTAHLTASRAEAWELVERFELAMRGAGDGMWDFKLLPSSGTSPQVYQSQRFKELVGYEDHEPENFLEDWQSRLHPADRQRAAQALRDHLEHRRPYDVEYRLRVKGGEYRWFQCRGQAVWDEAGRPTRMAGSLSDVTDWKQAQSQVTALFFEYY